MNLQRHHVFYVFLALSLMLALLVFMVPHAPLASLKPPLPSSPSSTASSSPAFRYEVVTTVADQERGLGGRSSIPPDYGMLFVFPEPMRVGFWMKDMLTPIDILWLSDTGTILGIEDGVSPDTYPQSFFPPRPVRYVLETRAGEAKRKGWEVGTQISLPAPYGLR